MASLRVAAGPCDAGAMPLHRPARRLPALLATTLLLAACTAQAPFAQLSGMLLDARLDEISGLAASQAHEGVLWMLDDGGNDPQLFAISTRGGLQATFQVAGVAKTDWEDIAAFELDGRRYLLVADTGDNGGLRRSLQLHVIEEPASLDEVAQHAPLEPAWSIAFRWPDGARDCEAVAVDARRGEVLLISKKRTPPELFALRSEEHTSELQSLMRISYAVFCLKKKNTHYRMTQHTIINKQN